MVGNPDRDGLGVGIVNADNSVRQRILDAALDLIDEQGIKALTQPRVAKAAGLRQSHLTYYFPRKADLLVAILQASHERGSKKRKAKGAPEDFDKAMKSLADIMCDSDRMRFFLGIVLEASEDPKLRAVLASHARGLAEAVAPLFGRTADDPAVLAFIDNLRGMGLRMLFEPDRKTRKRVDFEAIAGSFGLRRKTEEKTGA